MPQIALLSQETIDKIAAGEVIERPSSVVKELVENAIDAGANAVTVEIKEGGISLIRITDNGCGIAKEQIPLAFLRHSTSKIQSVEDLLTVTSLGFRGEALSSIAAVSQVELITKTAEEFTGIRYVIEGSKEQSVEEIGAPEGTTFIVRNLFYNTPARRKFLKSAQTEGGYIHDLMQKMMLSHPDVSFKFILNGQVKLQSSGNGNIKDIVYHIFGRGITAELLELKTENEYFSVQGFVGKPQISRGNRNYEICFINGRYIRSNLLSKAIEEAYKPFLMQHQYPFSVCYFRIDSELLDVNVHPTKMELRFSNQQQIYENLVAAIRERLVHRELIPQVPVTAEKKKEPLKKITSVIPEPFEKKRLEAIRQAVRQDSPYEPKYDRATNSVQVMERDAGVQMMGQDAGAKVPELAQSQKVPALGVGVSGRIGTSGNAEAFDNTEPSVKIEAPANEEASNNAGTSDNTEPSGNVELSANAEISSKTEPSPTAEIPQNAPYVVPSAQTEAAVSEETSYGTRQIYEQTSFLDPVSASRHKIIGQAFDTYWIVEFDDKLYIIDQHAAHEKVLYERMMKQIETKEFTSQRISPPMILTVSMLEEETLKKFLPQFERLGYEIEHFGGNEYTVSAVPGNMFRLNTKELMVQMLDELEGLSENGAPDMILERVASMSCKAAVKGNQRLSRAEAEHLIEELLSLENPYNCPHGRPTIIAMTKYELEKKFKRIL